MIQPGNILTLIFHSIYSGINNICVGILGIPVRDAGIGLAVVIGTLIMFAVFMSFRRKNSFSLDRQ